VKTAEIMKVKGIIESEVYLTTFSVIASTVLILFGVY